MLVPPERYNVSEILDANLDAGRGDKVAIYCGDERVTYEELFDRVCRMGNALTELGVRPEERILLVLDDSPAFPVAFFGATRIGAVPVPVNPRYRAEDYRFFVEDSDARVVVVDDEFLDPLSEALKDRRGRVTIINTGEKRPDAHRMQDLLDDRPGVLAPANTHRDDMAFWLYSSGFTGNPKAVVHLHRDIPYTCETYARHVLQIREDDIVFGRVLLHAYGLGNAITFPLWVGASIIFSPGRPTPQGVLEAVQRYRPTVFCIVPTLYNAILNDPASASFDLSSVRLCISAAELLPPETWRRWKEQFGLTILDGIGSTELLHIFCSNTADAVKPGSSGKPVPGYELRIIGDDDRPVAPGETGNLLVKGGSAAPFYWHRREKSRETMQGEWVFTGDRYRVDAEGFYWYEGRADDMIKVGGEWVSPIEIENVLLEHSAVDEAAVIGVRVDGIMRIKAVIVLGDEGSPNDDLTSELQTWCKTRLQRFQYPHVVEFATSLPKTMTGKIQRFRLRADS